MTIKNMCGSGLPCRNMPPTMSGHFVFDVGTTVLKVKTNITIVTIYSVLLRFKAGM